MSVLELQATVGSDPDGVLVVAAGGEIDLETAPRLKDWLADALATDMHTVVLDLAQVSFMDSSGLTALLVAHNEAAKVGRTLVLRGPTRQTRDLFVMTGLDQVFTIES